MFLYWCWWGTSLPATEFTGIFEYTLSENLVNILEEAHIDIQQKFHSDLQHFINNIKLFVLLLLGCVEEVWFEKTELILLFVDFAVNGNRHIFRKVAQIIGDIWKLLLVKLRNG